MSVYLSLLFGFLVMEMVVLFILVMPLPHLLRRVIVVNSEKLLRTSELKTAVWISYALIGLLFLDSWKRVSQAEKHYEDGFGDRMMESSMQNFVTKTYNQRNLYITGFILYFSICIPTVLKVIESLSKHEQLLKEGTTLKEETKDLKALEVELKNKKATLKALKAQKANLEAHFDKVTEPSERKTAKTKKRE
ncbi:Yet2p Ecym_2295 [Eremothecium cymbalariae DBVPG|uniref:Endoplasmic reticulum transmembrane protein n=1 Tax=Eremothecium cymbalariae (strain CBS 270.75 / DBVPG 7215 / KCTC 17166 / NRRL Y-17582) TaxID=931890 RepID=G8JQ35_ERECY|nr:Hypothetical protein Ecym_2295 [Eremothecium cymbalariae DBVPG\